MWRIGSTMRDSSIGGTDLSAVKFPNEEKIAPTNEEKIAPKRWYRIALNPRYFIVYTN